MKIIDVHIHPIPSVKSIESFVHSMNEAGVDKAVLIALKLEPDIIDNDSKLQKQLTDNLYSASLFVDHHTALKSMIQILKMGNTPNSTVFEWIKDQPDKFYGVGSANPRQSKKEVKIDLEEIREFNLLGIKVMPTLQFFNPKKRPASSRLHQIFKFARKYNKYVMVHLGADPGPWELHTMHKDSNPEFWTSYLDKYSDVKVLFAHFGGYGKAVGRNWILKTIEMMEKYRNLFVDTAAVPHYLRNNEILEKIRKHGVIDKILFGSDDPVVIGTSMWHSLQLIKENEKLSDEEKNKILSSNAINFLSNFIEM